MVFTFIALWTITAVLIFTDWKTETTRWVAAVTFTGGAGGFAESIPDTFIPYLNQHDLMTPVMTVFLNIAHSASFFIVHNLIVYSYLVFTVCYSGFFSRKTVNFLKVVLLIPTVFMFYITPLYPEININFRIMFIWVAPYILIGTFLLVYSYINEKNPQMKNSRKILVVAGGFPMIFVLFSNYLARCFELNNLFRYNAVIIAILFVFIIVMIIKSNFLGIKLKLEKQRLDSTMKALYSGTSILNHTIKNEVTKISMCADIIKDNNLDPETKKSLDNISESTNYMLNMVTKVQDHLKDINLKVETVRISDVIDQAVKLNSLFIEKKKVIVNINEYDRSISCNVDVTHVVETISNILKNSIESMKDGNKIDIQVFQTKKYISICIADSGVGISPENLQYVKDPFFTTKRRTLNFGLGLSYCYNVMQQHCGELDIQSEYGLGTKVYLNFPNGNRLRFGRVS